MIKVLNQPQPDINIVTLSNQARSLRTICPIFKPTLPHIISNKQGLSALQFYIDLLHTHHLKRKTYMLYLLYPQSSPFSSSNLCFSCISLYMSRLPIYSLYVFPTKRRFYTFLDHLYLLLLIYQLFIHFIKFLKTLDGWITGKN